MLTSAYYRKEIKKLLHLAWPIIGAQVLMLAMVLTDSMMVARLGTKPLAALAMAGALYNTLYLLMMGILSAMSPAISQAYGTGDHLEIGKWVRQGWRLSFMLAFLLICILLVARPILVILGQEQEVAAVAQVYLNAMVWGVPGQLLYFCGRTLCEGTADSRPSILISGMGLLLNLGLNWIFIFGNLGFPALGVAGSGYATSTVNWLMAAAIVFYIAHRQRYRPFGFFEKAPLIQPKILVSFLRVGLPISGSMLAEVGFFAAGTLAMGTLGSAALASHQIALNAVSLTFMVPLGLAFATSIRVGHARGREDLEGIIGAGRSGFMVTAAVQCLWATLFIVFPGAVTAFYTSDPELKSLAVTLLRIGGVFQIFDGLQIVGINALRGLRDTKMPFLNTIISFWLIGAPSSLWLMKIFGPSGIWYGLVLGLAITSMLHIGRFQRLSRRLSEHASRS